MPEDTVTPDHPNYSAAAIAHMQLAVPGAVTSLGSAPTLWQQLLALVLGFLSGVGGKVKVAIPGLPESVSVSLTEQFSALGKSWTLVLKLHEGNLILTLMAQ